MGYTLTWYDDKFQWLEILMLWYDMPYIVNAIIFYSTFSYLPAAQQKNNQLKNKIQVEMTLRQTALCLYLHLKYYLLPNYNFQAISTKLIHFDVSINLLRPIYFPDSSLSRLNEFYHQSAICL